MKVWVVSETSECGHVGGPARAVCSSKERAEAWMKVHPPEPKEEYYVAELELDKE